MCEGLQWKEKPQFGRICFFIYVWSDLTTEPMYHNVLKYMMKPLPFIALFFLLMMMGTGMWAQDSIGYPTEEQVVSAQDTLIAEVKPYQVAVSGFSFESMLRGLLGLVFLVGILFVFSTHKRSINWGLVIKGISLQIVFAVLVLYWSGFRYLLDVISGGFLQILSFTRNGVNFLFADKTGSLHPALETFAFTILPTVIFFSALTSLLFYFGILQKVVYVLAYIMRKLMKISGAESLSSAGNIFLGQTEAPLLVRPYLENMTRSEILCIMTGGMATIAGGVLASFILFLGGDDPEMQKEFAKHLITASVLSAPAAIVCAKILLPEKEAVSSEMKIPKDRIGSNFLEAIANGTTDGLKLAVNVGAMLLVFIAMVAMVNYFLEDIIGYYSGLNAEIQDQTNSRYSGLNMQFMLGYIGAPIAWMVGVPHEDMVLVGQLLGQKTVLNEFYGYMELGRLKNEGQFIHEKSIILATYILCGFSNFASIGIQIGGIGALAPGQRANLSKLGFRALLGGTVACLMTASVAGMFL